MPHSKDGAAECVMVAKDVEVLEKTGTVFSCSLHFFTAMIGVAVLAVSQAMANLGWVAGSITLISIYLLALLVAYVLASVYEVDGVQHPRFYEAVSHVLGKRSSVVAVSIQMAYLFLLNIAFSITATISMRSVANLACGIPVAEWNDPPSNHSCFNTKYPFTLIFGGAMALVVQVGSLESSGWLSMLGALTSIIYPCIAFGLCVARLAQGHHYGTVGGITYGSSAAKAFNVLNALGTMIFSFSFSGFFLEIQDTIKEPPKAVVTMNKVSVIVLSMCGLLYGTLSVMGYVALGSAVPDNLLTAFDSPQWLLIIANITVVINMVASFNILAQTTFLTVEGWVARRFNVVHPAEEAALQAAAAVMASEHDMLHGPSAVGKAAMQAGGKANGGGDLMKRKLSDGGSVHLSSDDARASSAPPVLYTYHSGPQNLEVGQAVSSHALPSAALSVRYIRQRSQGVAKEGSLKKGAGGGSGRFGESSFTEKSNQVVHAVADLRDEHVSFIAGPFRMRSVLKCHHPVLHTKSPAPPMVAASAASMPTLLPSMIGGPSALAPVAEEVSPAGRWRWFVFSLLFRTAYVAVVTVIAVVMPFFSQVAGLIGGLVFWPLNIYFPFKMYIKVHKPGRGVTLALNFIMWFMFLVAMGAVIGSFRNIVVTWASSFCFAC